MTNRSEAELALRRLEQRRSDAMEQGDTTALDLVFADDFQLVHGDGSVDDKRGAIAAALRIPRRVVIPRDLTVRVFQDTALLTGPVTLAVTIEGHERIVEIFMTQVARFEAGEWRFIWSQVTIRTSNSQSPHR